MEVLISIMMAITIAWLCNHIKNQNETIEMLRTLSRSKDQLRDYADYHQIDAELEEEHQQVLDVLDQLSTRVLESRNAG